MAHEIHAMAAHRAIHSKGLGWHLVGTSDLPGCKSGCNVEARKRGWWTQYRVMHQLGRYGCQAVGN